MYFYRFNQFREDQSVVSCDIRDDQLYAGILIQEAGNYLLCLGEEVSRPELVLARHSLSPYKIIVQLCQQGTIDMIHRMVYERFSAYRDVIPLFFGSDIELLLKHKPLAKNTKVIKQHSNIAKIQEKDATTNSLTHGLTKLPQQILHIFPSLFALTQLINSPTHQLTNSLILSGQTSSVQRAKHYRSIQSGQIYHIFATHSQIFWDWSNLQEIVFHDEYSPFYVVHAEPRYTIPMVVEKMKTMIG